MTDASGLALATRGLRKSYGSHVALDGLDLSVPTGTVYGFLGPNGAGKTTTMRLLTGLIHPDAGTIELLGQPFGRRDRHRLYDVGALIESPSFYPFLSGRQNLRELAANGAPVGHGPDRGAARADRAQGPRERQSLDLLAGHEATPGDRRPRCSTTQRCCCSMSRPTAWIRPASSPCAKRCATSHRSARPSSSRATCWPRCSRWPTSSASLRPAGWSAKDP